MLRPTSSQCDRFSPGGSVEQAGLPQSLAEGQAVIQAQARLLAICSPK